MSRRKAWLALVVAVLVSAVAGVLWVAGWFDSPDARAEAERILSEAIGRPVHIETLEVEPLEGFVELKGVRVDNAPAWGPEPLMTARHVTLRVQLDDLLDRRVDGALRARGVALHVAKRGRETNLDRMGGPPRDGPEPVVLDLELVIEDANVDLVDLDRDETLQLQRVRVESFLSNRTDRKSSATSVHVDRVSLHGIDVDDLDLKLLADDEAVRLETITARVGQSGTISGAGGLELAPSTWSFDFELKGIALDGPIVPVVAAVYPPLIAVTQSEHELPQGRLSGGVALAGQGLRWNGVRPSLSGRGNIGIEDLSVPASSLLGSVARLAGAPPGPLTVDEAGARFTVAQEWIELEAVTVGRTEVESPIRGRVGLDGQLDLVVDLLPVLELLPGDAHDAVARYTASVPVRVRGTAEEPSIEPPSTKDVAKGVLGGALKRAVGQ